MPIQYNESKGDGKMESANVNVTMDAELKRDAEAVLNSLGLNMTSAITVFAKAVVRTGAIPFDVMIDPFERKEHQDELARRISAYESGTTQMIETTLEDLEMELYE